MVKYCGLAAFFGFTVGTAIAHYAIYARHLGQRSPGVGPAGLILLIVLGIVVSNLFDDVTHSMGELNATLIGLASLILGAVLGFAVRRAVRLGPPPPRI